MLDIISKLKSNEKVKQNDKRNKALSLGLNECFDNVENRSIITTTNAGEFITTKTEQIGYVNYSDEIFNQFTVFDDIKQNVKFPFIDPINNIQWWASGFAPESSATIQSKILKPHRIVAKLLLSSQLLVQNNEIEEKFISTITSSIVDKILETMFDDGAGNDLTPAGLFNNVEVTELSSYEDLLDFKYEADKMKVKNSFILSPFAQRQIFNMKDGNLIKDGKLLGADAFNVNQMKDGYIICCPLDFIYFAKWNYISYTINPFMTNPFEGVTEIIVDANVDFCFINNDYLKVGRFVIEDNNNNDNN